MIIDKIDNWGQYNFSAGWKMAFEFLQTLPKDAQEGRHEIQGDDIFAIVMSYQTQDSKNGILESHEKYVDIQTVLIGQERFGCAFSDDLEVDVAYDNMKDVTFYKHPKYFDTIVDIHPNKFVMLYPHDAHIAGLIIDKQDIVKKVVVKIKKELLELS